jgi:hypothetical protein
VPYIQKSIQSPDNPDALARALLGIADRAETRLLPPLQEHDNLDRKRNRRRMAVAKEIIPALKGKLLDSMSTRIARHSVEQKFIERELPTPAADQIYVSIPKPDFFASWNSGASRSAFPLGRSGGKLNRGVISIISSSIAEIHQGKASFCFYDIGWRTLCGISQKDGFACAFMDGTVIGTRASA